MQKLALQTSDGPTCRSSDFAFTTRAVLACRRRELLLKSVNVGVLAALFNFGAVARPDGLGIQVRFGMCPQQGTCAGLLPHTRTACLTFFATGIVHIFADL